MQCGAKVDWDERMKKTNLCFTLSNRACGEHSRNSIYSAAWYAFNSFIILVRARDSTTLTLHDLADFYIDFT